MSDGHLRIWRHDHGVTYVTDDGRHYDTWSGLRARYDLVEVA